MSPQSSFLSNRHNRENSLISCVPVRGWEASLIGRFWPATCKLASRLRRNRERELAESFSDCDARKDLSGRCPDLDEVLSYPGRGTERDGRIDAGRNERGRQAESQEGFCQERKE